MEWDGILKATGRERFSRLRQALRDRRSAAADALAAEYSDCGSKWRGRYECGSPGCPDCRRRMGSREGARTVRAFTGADNDDLGLLTLVHAATLDAEEIGDLQRKSRDVLRKRIGTLRGPSSPYNGLAANGWFEVDAVSAEHFPDLFPKRRQLLKELAIPLHHTDPTWIVTSHSIVYLNGMPLKDVKKSLSAMWNLPCQLDLRGLRDRNPVEDNLRGIASYATKFCCTVELKADVEGGKVFMPWPVNWEADLCSWMNSYQRNIPELLRFSIGQAKEPVEITALPLLEPMPFTWSIS